MESRYKKYEPVFGSWYIVKRLGQGSEGELYRIRREDEFGHVYYSALKAITIPGDDEAIGAIVARGVREADVSSYYDDIISRHMREFRLMYELKGNSHIVSYEDHQVIRHEDDPGCDILIRIEELEPLLDHVKAHPLTPEDVRQMGIDICRGLVFCKSKGIIHRDIKPENIFVASGGNYKLGDFGIAQVLEYTQTIYTRKGTNTYMAPEVHRGEGYKASVDLYSLGLVMYKYLNDGRLPFLPAYPKRFTVEDEEMALAKRISGKEFPMPLHGSDRLKQIVMKACCFDTKERYQSADEMLADLEQDDGSHSGIQLKQHAKRRRIGIAAAVLAILAAAVFTIWSRIPKEITAINGIADDTIIYVGEKLAPDYQIEPERFADQSIVFESTDPSVLTVDSDGVISAVAVGESKLSMKADGFTRKVSINVIAKITSIDGIDEKINLDKGKTKALKPKLQPDKFASEPVVFKSSDPKTVSVDANGVIKAVSPGTCTITIEAGGFITTVTVTVAEPKPAKPKNDTDSSPSQESGTNHSGGSGGTTYRPSGNQSGSGAGSSGGSSGNGYFNSADDEYF